jgi:acyl carrier protein
MTIRDEIRQFILKDIMRKKDFKLGDADSLIKGGLIDSWSLAQVGMFLEDTYALSVPDSDLTVENMDTIDMIARYVEAKRAE